MQESVRVWDPFIRIFHWSLVASFFIAWFSADEMDDLHEFAGYAAGALVLFRLVLGLAGSRYARFSQFVRSPITILNYMKGMATGHETRYLGHNPPGGMMVLALIAGILTLSLTGILLTLDSDFDWAKDVHETVANLMLLLVAFHVGGVVLASVRHKENLVRSMLTGRKCAAEPGDVA